MSNLPKYYVLQMPSAILRKLEENVGGMGKIRVVLRVANSGASPTRTTATADEESLRKHFQVSLSYKSFHCTCYTNPSTTKIAFITFMGIMISLVRFHCMIRRRLKCI